MDILRDGGLMDAPQTCLRLNRTLRIRNIPVGSSLDMNPE